MAPGAPSTTSTGDARPAPLSPAGLTPGYFAGVMATGIVSVGAQLRGLTWLAVPLFWVAVCFYLVLVTLTAWRFVAHRDRMSEDFRDPARAFGFFTFIAATNDDYAPIEEVGRQLDLLE